MAGSLRRETELQCSGQRFYFSGDFFKNNFSFKRKKSISLQGQKRAHGDYKHSSFKNGRKTAIFIKYVRMV